MTWDACKFKISASVGVYRSVFLLNLVFDFIYSSVLCLDCRMSTRISASKLKVSKLIEGSVNRVL